MADVCRIIDLLVDYNHVVTWWCAKRHYEEDDFTLVKESCVEPASAPVVEEITEVAGQEEQEDDVEEVVRLVPRVQDEYITPRVWLSVPPQTVFADVRVQTESWFESQVFARDICQKQLGGYTSPGGGKIHLSRRCIQQCSPMGSQAVIVYRDWCRLCSGPDTCHHDED